MTLPRWQVVDQCNISQQLNESSAFWQLLDPSRVYLKNNPQPPWNTTWQPRTERTHFQSESDCVVGNHEDRAAMSSESGHGSDTIALLHVLGRLLWSVSNRQGCRSRHASAVQSVTPSAHRCPSIKWSGHIQKRRLEESSGTNSKT